MAASALLGPPSVEVQQESAVISVQPAEKIATPKGRSSFPKPA